MGAPPAGSSFGYAVGGIFIFNLIVGTGSLALPSGWNQAGLVSGFLMTILIFILAYICVTFVIEVQSVATVLIKKKDPAALALPINEAKHTEIDSVGSYKNEESISSYGDINGNTYPYYEDEGGQTAFILEQVEMGAMAETLLGKGGRLFFYIVLLVYLYGDLAIYAVAVPQSVLNTLTPDGMIFPSFTIPRYVCYWFYLFVFSVAVLPFCFVNFSNSKYLQFFTIICRNLAFVLMIVIAFGFIFTGNGAEAKDVDYFTGKGLPGLWGTVIYCFMCHHSIPGLISPLKEKRKVNALMFMVYCGILVFYLLLSSSALFAFGSPYFSDDCTQDIPCQIQSLYTYNFLSFRFPSKVVAYYLGLFPVFTLTSNYPLIAITLRNNMMKIFPFGEKASWAQGTLYRQYLFAVIASFPSLMLAAVFTDVDALVSLTGSYAGLFIEFVIPVTLVYYARKVVKEQYPGEVNPYRSPFQSPIWLVIILLVAAASLIVVTLNNVFKFYEFFAD